MVSTGQRRHWIWVTRPEYYANDDGSDRPDLDPPNEGEWTCSPDTRRGDLALLYRTAPRSDIAYLLEAVSNPFVVDWEGELSGSYACEFVSRAKFTNHPLTFREMREDPKLGEEFGPVRMQFQGRAFQIDKHWWDYLRTVLIRGNPESAAVFERLEGPA